MRTISVFEASDSKSIPSIIDIAVLNSFSCSEPVNNSPKVYPSIKLSMHAAIKVKSTISIYPVFVSGATFDILSTSV